MTMTRKPRNAIQSQERRPTVPYVPSSTDLVPGVVTTPGYPPDAKAYAMTIYDGRQNLMRDFYYKIPVGAFLNVAAGTPLPTVSGSPVVQASTQFLYPLSIATQFADIAPSPLANAAQVGAGGFVALPAFPRGSGFRNTTDADQLTLPIGACGNPGLANWTLEFWGQGNDWQSNLFSKPVFSIGAGNAVRILAGSSLGGSNFQIRVQVTSGETFNVETSVVSASLVPFFFSVTRRGNNVFFHINGVLRATIDLSTAVNPSFNFAAQVPQTSPAPGSITTISDLRFTNGALYSAAGYSIPTIPLTPISLNNSAQFAFQTPVGFRQIIRRVTFAGGVQFADDTNNAIAALSSAAGPSDDFFQAIAHAPQLTIYRNSDTIPFISYGNTSGVNDSNNIGEYLFGPISFDLYEIFNGGDVFAVGLALNDSFAVGDAFWNMAQNAYCYVYGNYIPSDESEINETGLTKVNIPVRQAKGLKIHD